MSEGPHAKKVLDLDVVRESKLDGTTCVSFRYYQGCPAFQDQEEARKKAAE